MVLPFTSRIFYSFISRYNAELWPAQLGVLALALVAVAMVFRPGIFGGRAGRLSGRIAGLLIAAAWARVGYDFYWLEFARMNFVAPVYAPLFGLQALLLLVTMSALGNVGFAARTGAPGKAGRVLIALALIGWPAADAILGPGIAAARLPGLAPGPTVLMTLGVLLCAENRAPYHLAIIPVLWCLATIATGFSLAMWQDVIFALAGAGAGIMLVAKNRE
jgi:hypothetical protein